MSRRNEGTIRRRGSHKRLPISFIAEGAADNAERDHEHLLLAEGRCPYEEWPRFWLNTFAATTTEFGPSLPAFAE